MSRGAIALRAGRIEKEDSARKRLDSLPPMADEEEKDE
jgi:hypothetical protein